MVDYCPTGADRLVGSPTQQEIDMTSKRYTAANLRTEVETVNQKFAESDIDWCYVVGGRNGYTALDGGTVEITDRHCINTTHQCGSPRECRDAMYRDAYYRMAK